MKKIIDYVVLADDGSANSTKMPQMVVSWIRQGWQPFGGLCFCAANNSLYQAMVKYEEEPDPEASFPMGRDYPNPAPDQWERPGEV